MPQELEKVLLSRRDFKDGYRPMTKEEANFDKQREALKKYAPNSAMSGEDNVLAEFGGLLGKLINKLSGSQAGMVGIPFTKKSIVAYDPDHMNATTMAHEYQHAADYANNKLNLFNKEPSEAKARTATQHLIDNYNKLHPEELNPRNELYSLNISPEHARLVKNKDWSGLIKFLEPPKRGK